MENRFKVINVTPRGFCKGVYSAIELAKKARIEYPETTISILGELVHNKDVTAALNSIKINTIETKGRSRLDLLDEISEGIVIFSAHGISKQVEDKAREKGLITINASCVDVVKTQNLIKNYLDQSYIVFYIGQKNHPEAEAALSLDQEKVILVEINDELPFTNSSKIFVTNQTTMSIFDIFDTLSRIKFKYPSAILSNETCDATRLRQEAILKLPSTVDGMIIIGDKSSNNTKMLTKIAMNKPIKTVIQIQNINELDLSVMDECKELAITAGASTPKFIIDEINNYVIAYAKNSNVKKEDYLINRFI